MNQTKPFIALLLLLGGTLRAASSSQACMPEPPAPCNEEACCRTYCLGPANNAVNPPVNPITCNGDWLIKVAGFYWNFHQDAMEFAIDNGVTQADFLDTSARRFIDAKYEMPKTSWDGGFKIGLGYNTTCDGWDFGVQWTRFRGSSFTQIEADDDENHILLALWPSIEDNDMGVLTTFFVVTAIEAKWKLDLDLVDLELGREFWNSHRLSLRPFIGLRYASLKQNFHLDHRGGDFSNPMLFDPPVHDFVDLDNEFKGFGFRGGLNSVWSFGCGWGVYADSALSLVYGRFNLDHDENTRLVETPFTKTRENEIEKHYRALRLLSDLEVGIQWSSLFCDCAYGVTVSLGWEVHYFMDFNPVSRINQDGGNFNIQNLRSDLDTQGWTLSVEFAF